MLHTDYLVFPKMQNRRLIYFTEYKHIVRLGVPIVIGQIGTIILSFADTTMIGRHTTEELAAAAFVGQMFMLGILLAMGFAYGLTPIIGNLFSREETGEIGTVVRNGLMANTVVAAILTVIYLVLYFFLDRLGQPEELIPLMRPYYIVNLLSLPFVCWFNVFKQTADATTDTQMPMWILLGGNMLNILGNWLLIYGKFGFPEMGLLGAGIATLVSRGLMTAAIAWIFFRSRRYASLALAFHQSTISRQEQLRQHQMGWPLGLQMAMESGAWALCSVIVGWIGTSALAGHQVMLAISQFFFQIYYAIAAAVAIRISFFHAQREYGKIVQTAWAGFHLNTLAALIVAIPVFLFRHQIGWLFTDSAEVMNIVATAIIPLLLYQVSDTFQCTYSNALRGLSDVKPMMYVAFIAYFVVSIPLSYLFGISMSGGLTGVWYSFPFGLSVAGILYYYFFRRRLRISKG